jgi:soluble lytic murein transglycosylase
MQLMPSTAKLVAKQRGLPYDRKRLTSDPSYNLELGRSYLEGLLGRYGGSYPLALAAYNAGPSRADRWIRNFGDPRDPSVDPVDWIESIPFDETRNYVQRIVEAVTVYRKRMTPGQPVLVLQPHPQQASAEPGNRN